MSLAKGLAPAVVLHLRADEELSAVCGLRVFLRDMMTAGFPYVVFGALKERAWNAGTERGAEIEFSLYCHAREGEREETLAVAQACAAALEGAPLIWTEARVVDLFFIGAEAALMRDKVIWRATARFRALVEGI